MLSGIDDGTNLSERGIPIAFNSPDGKNLHDHLMFFQYWKLQYPEHGWALGSPLFNKPVYAKGAPGYWLVTTTVPDTGLKVALAKDPKVKARLIADDHSIVRGPRGHLEMSVIYAAFGGESIGLQVPKRWFINHDLLHVVPSYLPWICKNYGLLMRLHHLLSIRMITKTDRSVRAP